MGYHKLLNLQSYWENRSPSFSVTYAANVMAKERFEGIRSNIHFSNNEEALPRDNPQSSLNI